MNIPLPGNTGDAGMRRVMDEIIAPKLQHFKPDVILVSAGYDAHWRDPLAGLQFQSRTYHFLSSALKQLADQLCGGKIVFLLEGGYDLEGLSDGVVESFRSLIQDPSGDTFDASVLLEEPDKKILEAISLAKGIHGL
eukprot:CAMPEP_0118934698 /NCGR_PEP_ID=MMETSP1169-20130426/13969_1 /TAXON_ID=36882 /ORGANISM="Pyramimonas obovata, Strain CCMP722" /LENGTH=136 /DNA_ID=CAMNT_0006877627 /DNA_START=11 /DNA_END=421 /DNA_ORIENTATION=-